jgi:hypothetical protein
MADLPTFSTLEMARVVIPASSVHAFTSSRRAFTGSRISPTSRNCSSQNASQDEYPRVFQSRSR